jgi:hypothetical protein
MEKPISPGLRNTFLIHLVIAGVLGLSFWLVPGRTLAVFGLTQQWVRLPESGMQIPGGTFVNPFIVRLFGAALLALAFSSFIAWRAKEWPAIKALVQLETVFCVLGAIATAYFAFVVWGSIPIITWIAFVLLVAFALAWGFALKRAPA